MPRYSVYFGPAYKTRGIAGSRNERYFGRIDLAPPAFQNTGVSQCLTFCDISGDFICRTIGILRQFLYLDFAHVSSAALRRIRN